MSGADVVKLIDKLGISRNDLAMLLGVHISTVYRWCSQDVVRVDPLHGELLRVLRKKPCLKLGAELSEVLRSGGALAGTYALLRREFESGWRGSTAPGTISPGGVAP